MQEHAMYSLTDISGVSYSSWRHWNSLECECSGTSAASWHSVQTVLLHICCTRNPPPYNTELIGVKEANQGHLTHSFFLIFHVALGIMTSDI